ncbi:hypothetical protein BDW74DRAFT_188302 [Aspergillus multicolor]|uniref:uncharacterized protein n=1 Tax=Aspergillus multicolor TaxID=41759 RepID=UPI003CCD85C2
MSNRTTNSKQDLSSASRADKRFFDEANATFQSDGGWYDSAVPDAGMKSRAAQGSRFQQPDLGEDEGALRAVADAAMDANPGAAHYWDEKGAVASKRQGPRPGWDTFSEQEDGIPFTRGVHLDEVMQGPSARHGNEDEGDEEKHMAMRQGRREEPEKTQDTQAGSATPGTYAGLEETWTSECLEELRKGGRLMPS